MIDIENILKSTEGKTFEYKRDISSLKPIMKTIVAFANTAGGIIVIGMDDDGTITGIDDVFQAEESLASAVSDSIAPAMMPEIEIVSFEGNQLVFVKVAHWRGPFYLKSEGSENGVYIRLGSTNRKADPEIIAELNRSVRGISFDQMPCVEINKNDLDIQNVRAAFKIVDKSIDKENLEPLELLVPYAGGIAPSNGSIILFGSPQQRNLYFPDARVSCARFRGIDKSHFIDSLDIEGSVLDAVEDIPKFIRRNTRLYSKIESFRREDIPAYPELAVREVLINALAHTDYSLTGMRILISIYTDRMEVQNPGMFPFGMTLDDFKAGVSKVRNRVVARVFRELGLMEEWGSGYKRILNACKKDGYPEPEWIELGSAVRVVFYPHKEASENYLENVPANVPINVSVNKRQRWFIEQLNKNYKISSAYLAEHWRVSLKTAKRDISELKQKGLIGFQGAAKNGFYYLI